MEDRRQYIRLNSCFPVEFSLVSIGPKRYQGFTCDISKGGLCIMVRNLAPEDIKALNGKKTKLDISINILPPLLLKPVRATCNAVWLEETKTDSSGTLYNIGASYDEIDERDRNRIINYARRLKWAPRITAAAIVILLISVLSFYIYQQRISTQNKVLISRLIKISDKANNIFERLNNLNQTKILLEKNLSASRDKIQTLENEISIVSELKTEEEKLRIEKLRSELHALKRQNQDLKNNIQNITKGEFLLKEKLASVEIKAGKIEQANIDKMKDWVSIHRNRSTGLVISYEGDKNYQDWSFTYDQALAVQLFLLLNDAQKAASILDFYKDKAKTKNGLFYNAYDAATGEVVEYSIHSGPNLWIAIAASKFTKATGNDKYLRLAGNIAQTMISMQMESTDGSIKGGPDTSWVSTEHNMDAYALFNMLYEITNEQRYSQAKDTALSWIKNSAYNKQEARFNRGKGDATIATDTFSWAIASIGPTTLKGREMNPDDIMEFAENECKVKTVFYRPDGKDTEVVGFDFAKAANLGRGGVISCEWTAQMIVAFKIMADYHNSQADVEKASLYSEKAQYYLAQLGKMVISSPSPSGQGEGCLPYASIDNVDTGHGWRVAKGRRTGSVAATIYYIFAQKSYNPLTL